jgi:hypothetical protein
MLRLVGILLLLSCGPAAAADLDIVPRPSRTDPRVAPAVPQPPVQLQTQPPLSPQKEEQPAAEQKPADTLLPPQADAPSGNDSWWQKIVREAPNCKSFSDGCRTCSPSYACSGLPIACQPKEFTCADPKASDNKPSADKP